MVRSGRGREGIAELEQGLEIYGLTGARVFKPSFLLLQAQAYFTTGDHQTARTILENANAQIDATGERINEAEILLNLGEIAHRLGETADAEKTLESAIAATTSLAWLMRAAGRKSEAAARLRSRAGRFRKTAIGQSWQRPARCLSSSRKNGGAEGIRTDGHRECGEISSYFSARRSLPAACLIIVTRMRRAGHGQNKLTPCAGFHSPAGVPGSRAPAPSAAQLSRWECPPERRCRPAPS